MNLKIFTFAFNRPDILELQYNTFKKHCKNDFEFIVIHDSRNYEYVNEFANICQRNNIKYFHHSSPFGKQSSEYHGAALQWTYDNIVSNYYPDDIIAFFDHDLFLVDDIDIFEYMQDCDILALYQEKEKGVTYAWSGFCVFKNRSLIGKDFDFLPKYPEELPEEIRQPLDTGGGTYKLFADESIVTKNCKLERIRDYNGFKLMDNPITLGFDCEFMCDNKFLHYRNASNWHTCYNVVDSEKTDMLFKIFNNVTAE